MLILEVCIDFSTCIPSSVVAFVTEIDSKVPASAA
jgi:hypothetical protein